MLEMSCWRHLGLNPFRPPIWCLTRVRVPHLPSHESGSIIIIISRRHPPRQHRFVVRQIRQGFNLPSIRRRRDDDRVNVSHEGTKTRGDQEELSRIVVDCGFQLHKELGPGLLETVYEGQGVNGSHEDTKTRRDKDELARNPSCLRAFV